MQEFKERLFAFAVAAVLTLGLLVSEDYDENAEPAATSRPAMPFNQTTTFNTCGQAGVSCR